MVSLGAAAVVAGAIKGSLDSFAQFERRLIAVGKTTNIAGAELAALGQSVRELSRDLPVSASRLLDIAKSAGQVGVEGSENILRFTETVGKLGLASDLSGEQAAISLTRILTVSGTAISEVDRLGSTIVQLGNNFAATESEIAKVATRVARSTSQFDVSAAQVLGISTALKAVGVQAESGGTQIGFAFQAINDALRNGGEEMELLRQITGRTGDALREDFFNGKSARVFQDFVNGLGKIHAANGDVTASLSAMGLEGSQAKEVFGTLATRTDLLADAMSQANREWDSNIALNKEAAIASESFSAQLQLVRNAADEAASAVGAIIAPAALDGLSAFRDASLAVADNIDTVADAAAVVAIVVGGKFAGALAVSGGAMAFNAVQAVRVQLALGRMGGASTAAAAGMLALGGAARGASASMALLGGPVGIALIAAGSMYYFRDALFSARVELGEAGEAVREYTDGLEDMTAATVESNRQSLAQQMRENTIAIAEAGAELDRLQEKQKSQNIGNQGRPGAATAQVRQAQTEVAVLTKLGGVMDEQLKKLDERAKQLATTAAESSASAAASLAATAEAAASAAAKVTAALQLELEYLRIQNALVLAGVSATEAEIVVMETKRELMLEAKGLTAEQAVEMVALEKAIKAGIEAQREEDQMLQNLRDQYGDTTKAVQDFADKAQLLTRLFNETGNQEYLRMLERFVKDTEKAGKKAAEAFKNPWEGVAQDVARSLQDAIASGDWDSLGEGIGNAFAASMSAVVSKSVSDSLSEGLTKDSAAISQISAAFAGPIAGAVVGGLVQLAVSELSEFLSGSDYDPTADRQDAQGAGTVLGSIDAKSDSIAKATEITASTNEELVNINTGMLQALKSVNAGIVGASAMIARAQGDVDFQTQNRFTQEEQALQGTSVALGGVMSGSFGGATALGGFLENVTGAINKVFGGILNEAVGFLDNLTGGLLSDIGSSVFGGDQKIVDEGINIVGGQITDLINDVMVQSFAEIKTDGGWFGSDDYDTEFAALPDEIRNQFSLVFEGIVDSVSAGAAAIGLLPADIQSALNQFRVESQLISLEDLDAGEQTAAIQEVFGTIFDNLATSVVPFLDDFQRAGEGLGETLARVATQVQLTEEAAMSLGFALDSALGAEMMAGISDSLVKLVGGIEAFSTAITSFESNFFTEAEQFDINARRLTQAMGDLPLPDTRQGFVDLLQAQDVTTASGREAVATLLRLQGSADDYYSFLESAAEDAAQAAEQAARQAAQEAANAARAAEELLNTIRGETDSALGDLQLVINERKAVLQDSYTAETDLIKEQAAARIEANSLVLDAAKAGLQAINQELSGITAAADSLRGSFEPAQAGLRANALAILSSALASGDLTGTGQAADVASDINAGTYTNSADYRAEQARTLYTLSLLQDDGESQLSTAEITVERLEEQNELIRLDSERQIQAAEAALNRELEALDLMYQNQVTQVDELRGIRAGVSTITEAIRALAASVGSEVRVTPEVPVSDERQGVLGLYSSIGRTASSVTEAEIKYWMRSELSGTDLSKAFLQSAAAYAGDPNYGDFAANAQNILNAPGFADGGMHSGGLRIVGERGPELEATGSSKIMSNSELMSSLGGNQKLASEMQAMHSDMMQGLNVIAKNTNKGSRQLERWDLTGLPAAREFV